MSPTNLLSTAFTLYIPATPRVRLKSTATCEQPIIRRVATLAAAFTLTLASAVAPARYDTSSNKERNESGDDVAI